MDIAKSIDRLSNKLDGVNPNELTHLLTSLENIIATTRNMLAKKTPPPPPHPPTPSPATPEATPKIGDLLQYSPQPLDDSLVARVHTHLKGLTYHPNPTSPNSPEIFLYGDHPYKYNQQSAGIFPTPIISSLPMAELLVAVNGLLNTSYNSILINKYKNLHCHLVAHKDDEKSLDPTSPISTLSLGATRRFVISLNDKKTVEQTVTLESRSLCTMLPGFQDAYYHAIAPGRNSMKREKGVRYSITFRRILSQSNKTTDLPNIDEEGEEDEEEEEDGEEEEEDDDDETDSPDTLVFGSSLTKELDQTKLSKYDKNFKVFSHSGASVKDIMKDVQSVRDTGTLKSSKVKSVFFVCGGNDIENLYNDSDIKDVCKDYEHLVKLTKDIFPHAKINIISLIPRRAKYRSHIDNMYEMNTWLCNFSRENSFRFVNIFSHFLLKLPHIWLLNRKLFNNSRLHFNKVGNSVLAKVLIGVANSPR